ncbi:MAG: hypothetical protein QW837_08245 [Conexivisphaerales archaeon]
MMTNTINQMMTKTVDISVKLGYKLSIKQTVIKRVTRSDLTIYLTIP